MSATMLEKIQAAAEVLQGQADVLREAGDNDAITRSVRGVVGCVGIELQDMVREQRLAEVVKEGVKASSPPTPSPCAR